MCGVDLGPAEDPTAIIVLHHTKTPLDTWTVNEKRRTPSDRTSRSI